MKNQIDYIDEMVIKLKVLDSRIQNLDFITTRLLSEVSSEFQQRMKELVLKKGEVQKIIYQLKDVDDNEKLQQ